VQGRVSVNIVAGSSRDEQRGYGDFLEHDERYERADEFVSICRAFWRGGDDVNFNGRYYQVEHGRIATPFVSPLSSEPELYISGHSAPSERLAYAHGATWLRVIDTPESLQPIIAQVKAQGLRVCLRLCVICRPTHEEAVRVAETLLPDETLVRRPALLAMKNDSQMYAEGAAVQADGYWLDRTLWAGFVPSYGPVWTTLLGTPRELADAFLAYKRIGVDEFIISGWPEVDEVTRLGRDVIPLVREAEHRQQEQLQPQPAMMLRA
jgi:alkanesulfonate monooxygenase